MEISLVRFRKHVLKCVYILRLVNKPTKIKIKLNTSQAHSVNNTDYPLFIPQEEKIKNMVRKRNTIKKYKHKRKRNPQDDYYKKQSPNKKKNKFKNKNNKSNVICHNCGNKGH